MFFLNLLYLGCFQLKIIHLPEWYILECRAPDPISTKAKHLSKM